MGQRLRFGTGKTDVYLDLETGDLELHEGTLTLDQWKRLNSRLSNVLVKQKLIPAPKQEVRSHGGPVKLAPWFLRPWFDKVIPKDRDY